MGGSVADARGLGRRAWGRYLVVERVAAVALRPVGIALAGQPDPEQVVSALERDREGTAQGVVVGLLVPADRQMPDSALTLLEGIRSPGKDSQSEFLRRMEKLNNGNKEALLCKEGYSAVTLPAHMTQEPLTEKQLITIFGHQERTALSLEDIWASWPDIYPGTEPSESLEVLSKSHAFRLVAWLKKQPDAPVVEVEVEVPCTCDTVAFAMLDAGSEPLAEAQAMWATALEALAEELPRTTFDTWLEATEGVPCEGEILVVKVPSVFTIAWLEQRMYQTILRAVRDSSGPDWDVRFEAGVAGPCRRHGTVEPAG